jgi:hypothetical protein
LLFLSLGILFGLGFRFYFKSDTEKALTISAKETAVITNTVRDSLQNIYRNTITALDNRLDSIWNNTDTLTGNLQLRLNEFYKLRKEITGLLKNGSSRADVALAGNKIAELQKKIDELNRRNQEVENENKRLNELLSELKNKPAAVQTAVPKTVQETKSSQPVAREPAANPEWLHFKTADIKLAAVTQLEESEKETSAAEIAEKLVASFVVKNNYSAFSNAEVEVVVTQPNGEVLQPSAWESGTFDTPEGKKIYSRKMKFDYQKGESKKLRITLSAEKFMPGNYILQLYHNGLLIGKTVRLLS